jgi:chitinase
MLRSKNLFFRKKWMARFSCVNISLLILSCTTSPADRQTFQLDGHLNSAYWQNWHNPPANFMRLTEIPCDVNRVFVAFALPEPEFGRMSFEPHGQSQEDFRADLNELQSHGVKVLISVGGGNHVIALRDVEMENEFVESMKNIIETFGFDGLDINLEGSSIWMDEGDVDFKNPSTAKLVHFISAMRRLKATFGKDFLLSAAPETQYVVAGYQKYGDAFGGYLPLLDALRDDLDVVHMQLYNSGSQLVYTGNEPTDDDPVVEQGTADFVVALTEMLILGFPVAGEENGYFEGLGADKVAIGLPATPSAASGGYLEPAEFRNALQYLITGQPDYDTGYILRKPEGYPDLKGGMNWSVNWDRSGDGGTPPFAFVQLLRKEITRLLEGTTKPQRGE